MPSTDINGIVVVQEWNSTAHFPNPGNPSKLYYDLSTGNNWATGDFYIWDSDDQDYKLYQGPHPIRPPH